MAKVTEMLFDGTGLPPAPLKRFSRSRMQSLVGNPDPLVVVPDALAEALAELEASPPSPDEGRRPLEAQRAAQVALCRWLLWEGRAVSVSTACYALSTGGSPWSDSSWPVQSLRGISHRWVSFRAGRRSLTEARRGRGPGGALFCFCHRYSCIRRALG